MSSLLRILKSASALWPLYVGIFLAATSTAALGLVSPFIVREATNKIVATVGSHVSTADATHSIIVLALILLATDLLNTILRNIGGYCGDVMASRLRQILSTRYYAKLLALPQKYFDAQTTGTIIARLDRSIMTITQFLQSLSNNFLPMMLQVAAILVITGVYYWPLAILLALLFPIYVWLTAQTSKKWQVWEGEKNAEIDQANGRFAETISQVKVVKSFVAESRELSTFGRRYQRIVSLTRPQSSWWHKMDTARGAAMNLIFFGIYLMIFLRTLRGNFTIGDMVMLLQLVAMAQQPIYMLSFIIDAAQRSVAGSKDYFTVMEEELEPTANPELNAATLASDAPMVSEIGPRALPVAEPVIALDHVSFAYEENKPVLDNISFTASDGHKIALVGESGGGKSTIVNLLLGLYQANSGTLTVCGRDVSGLTTTELRASVGVVFQEPFLFSGTVRENIAYGKPNTTDEEILEVAKRANAHSFIMAFPDGYNTVVGERGLRLSGGQKQRVAIARAMLKDAPVLILDEATSALDNKAERAVQAGLDELMRDRTTLIIAHRLSTIADVDTIVTLDHGRVSEIGSPDELARSGGIYAELLRLTASSSAADRQRLKKYGFVSDYAKEHEDPEPADT